MNKTNLISIPHLERIRKLYPDLPLGKVTLNNDGLVNQVVVVNNERIFRFPRSSWAREALRHEARILDLLGGKVEVTLPYYDYLADDVATYELVRGRTLARNLLLRLDEAGQEGIAEQLALFLRTMHEVPAAELQAAEIGKSDTVRTREDWVKLYERVNEQLFPYLMTHAKEWVYDHFSWVVDNPYFMEHDPVLMHGDISCYHILFDEGRRRIGGVIDFGTAGIGDPAADFACVIYQYGESFLKRMSHTYPAIADHIDRARFWAGTLELQWALGGLRDMQAVVPEDDRNKADWSWFTAHIGMNAKDVRPIGSAF